MMTDNMDIQDLNDRSTLASDRGASMVEYALLLALIAMIAVGAVGAFGGGLTGEFSDIQSTVELNLQGR
jgi:pilus assembly protein Flp/PilA